MKSSALVIAPLISFILSTPIHVFNSPTLASAPIPTSPLVLNHNKLERRQLDIISGILGAYTGGSNKKDTTPGSNPHYSGGKPGLPASAEDKKDSYPPSDPSYPKDKSDIPSSAEDDDDSYPPPDSPYPKDKQAGPTSTKDNKKSDGGGDLISGLLSGILGGGENGSGLLSGLLGGVLGGIY